MSGSKVKAKPMDTPFEILSVVPKERSPDTERIHTVMMQPVADEPKACLSKTLNRFKCDNCDKQFRLVSHLKLHAKIHSNTGTDKLLSSRESATTRHKRIKGRRNMESGIKFKTQKNMKSKANNTINHKTNLRNYKLTTHKDMESRVINKTKHNIQSRPISTRLKNYMKPDNGTKSEVNKADKNKTRSKLNADLTLNFKCKFCDKSFATPAHLSRHTHVHTGIRPFTCEKCNKSFKDASVLTRHLLIHSDDRPYSCKICTKSFIQSKDLKYHLRSHSGDRPYQCQTCKKCFSSASYLTVHKRIHTGVKPYVCPVCNAGFQASGTLARHQRSHSAEKQHKCSECPKAFTRSTNLKLHIQAHHCDT